MKKLIKKNKQKRNKELDAYRKERKNRIKQQEKDDAHMPTQNPNPSKGYIANAKQGKPMTHEQADSGNVNPYLGKGFIGYRTNCQTCVATYIARLQGYDVTALPNLNNKHIAALSYDCFAIFEKNGKRVETKMCGKGERKLSFLKKTIEEGKNHSIAFSWVGQSSGHTIIATKKNGNIELYDPQINETYRGEEVKSYLYRIKSLRATESLEGATVDKEWADKIMKEAKR